MVYHEGMGKEILPGLIAKFRGPQRLFDSEASQIQNEWTDEEREFVENRLLAHKDFGKGLYLAPGQEMPEGKSEHVRDKSILARKAKRCQNITTEAGDIVQCPAEAAFANQFCDKHRTDKGSQIVKGMLTTDGSTGPGPVAAFASEGPLGD